MKAGAGRERITPPVGNIMFGYSPGRAAARINDDLNATAIAVNNNGCSVLMLSLDVCGVNESICNEIRRSIEEKTAVPFENIVITATHTHSGPNLVYDDTLSKIDYDYISTTLIPACTAAAASAVESLCPATVGIGTIESTVGVNRRQLSRDGEVRLGQNPWGVRDPVMTVVAFRDSDGKPIASMVHYAAHCTSVGENDSITRDWTGYMIDGFEHYIGGIAGFYSGPQGDQGPRLPTGGTSGGSFPGNMELASLMGSRAALDAVNAYRSINEWRDVPVKCTGGKITVPYLPMPSEAEVAELLAKAENDAELAKDSSRFWDKYEPKSRVRHYKRLLEAMKKGIAEKSEYSFEQSIITIGPVAFVPFQFEVVAEIGLRLRQFSPFAHTLTLALSQGYLGYFVTEEQLCHFNTETLSWRYTPATPYRMPDNADDTIVTENLRLLDNAV